MTLEKFNKLSVTFMDVGLRDPEVVAGVIDIIVEKAQMEPHFSRSVACPCRVCVSISLFLCSSSCLSLSLFLNCLMFLVVPSLCLSLSL